MGRDIAGCGLGGGGGDVRGRIHAGRRRRPRWPTKGLSSAVGSPGPAQLLLACSWGPFALRRGRVCACGVANANFSAGWVGAVTHHSEPASRDDEVCELLPAAAEANVGGGMAGAKLAVSKESGRVRLVGGMRRCVGRRLAKLVTEMGMGRIGVVDEA